MWTSTLWLRDYLDPVPPLAEAAELLTMAGFPVEEFRQVNGRDVMDVEITSNRPDLFCHVGVARELAALTGHPFKSPKLQSQRFDQNASIEVAIEDPEGCPHYTGRVIRGVTIGHSPEWMQQRLLDVGLRPINNVVDVTNFVLFELGQPLHAFNLDKLQGSVVVRRALDGESIKTLDGTDRKLLASDLVITDDSGPIALAGVMGGEATEVSETTVDIFLESARFDPLSVRKTSRRLKLMSDSSFRFERGLDPTLAHRAGERAAGLIAESAGGTIEEGVSEAGVEGMKPKDLTMRWSALPRLLGVDFDRDRIVSAFEKLGLSPSPDDGGVTCTVPTHRLDLNIEVDLVEEAARIIGYDAIPTRDHITIEVEPENPRLKVENLIRDLLTAAGHDEAITFSFIGDDLRDAFVAEGTKLRRVDPNVRKADGHLRPMIVPGLLQAVRHNETVGNGPTAFFELGDVFWQQGDQEHEVRRLGIVGGSFAELRGRIEMVLRRLDPASDVDVEPATRVGFEAGATGAVRWGTSIIGHVGLVDAKLRKTLDLDYSPAMAELDLDDLITGYRPSVAGEKMSRFPAAQRDVSLVVNEDLAYAKLASLAQAGEAMPDLVRVLHSGTYRGKPLEKGTKSVTLTLVFQRDDETVPREVADAQVEHFVDRCKAEFQATLRS
jgi:phenylalanyl-tRNA synthetase beta chain